MNWRDSVPWNEMEGAVFLIGLAIVAWQGWWWPGILIVLAVTALVDGFARQQKQSSQKARPAASAKPQAESQLVSETSAAESTPVLPDRCPNCGGNLDANHVDRTSNGVGCPYCGTRLAAA